MERCIRLQIQLRIGERSNLQSVCGIQLVQFSQIFARKICSSAVFQLVCSARTGFPFGAVSHSLLSEKKTEFMAPVFTQAP